MQVDFCIPVYNEEQILESSILRLLNYLTLKKYNFNWNIIIIDNNSYDKTKEIASRLVEQNSTIVKLISINKSGKGRALKHYWKISDSDVLVYMDVDLSVSLANLDELIYPVINNNYDLVMGSRLLRASQVDRSLFREFSSRSYSNISRLILGHSHRDLQCGFKAAKTRILRKYTHEIINNTWFFDTEMVSFFDVHNHSVLEIPVNWKEERYNKRESKINVLFDGYDFFRNLLELKKRLNNYKINNGL